MRMKSKRKEPASPKRPMKARTARPTRELQTEGERGDRCEDGDEVEKGEGEREKGKSGAVEKIESRLRKGWQLEGLKRGHTGGRRLTNQKREGSGKCHCSWFG